MAEHTPGPWRLVHDSEFNDADFATREYRWPWQIHGADGTLVVDFTGGNEVSDENANLIAAAPDLLAALEAIAEDCDRYGRMAEGAWDSAAIALQSSAQQARTVIARARGEQRP